MKKIICLVLVVLAMGTMYYFSSQEGNVSKMQSDKVVNMVDEIRQEVTIKDSKLISIKDKVFNVLKRYGSKSYIIRKLAHFSIYACIGISLCLMLYVFTKRVFISATLSFIISALYAYYDEMRQLSVAGRVGSIKDVFIDSSGAITGIIILVVIIVMFNGIRGFFNFLFKKNNYEETV